MRIEPYEGVDSLRFDKSSQSDVIALYGEPTTIRRNRSGAVELHYNDLIARFDPDNDTLREITLLPYVKTTINGLEVTWDHTFLQKLCKSDTAPRDAYGYIVFTKFGVAVTGIHDNDESQLAITLFSKRDLDEFVRGSTPFPC